MIMINIFLKYFPILKKMIWKKNEFKFIIIGTYEMILNLSNNMIEQYFMDCTYKCAPTFIYKFKLMAISGFDISQKKTVLCLFVLIIINEKKLFLIIYLMF